MYSVLNLLNNVCNIQDVNLNTWLSAGYCVYSTCNLLVKKSDHKNLLIVFSSNNSEMFFWLLYSLTGHAGL